MPSEKATGLRVIIAYKLGKSVLQAAAALALVYGAHHGLAAELGEFSAMLRDHATHPWSVAAARALMQYAHGRHDLIWTAVALGGDAVVSSIEGIVLQRGYRWGPWVVVGATGSLLPFELLALIRRPRAGRAVLFAVNLAIVAYLARRQVRMRA